MGSIFLQLQVYLLVSPALFAHQAYAKPLGGSDKTSAVNTTHSSSETVGSPDDLFSVRMEDIKSLLQDDQFIGLNPGEEDQVKLPANQPRICPARYGSWYPRKELNLRSSCPWIYEVLDNGPDASPRYLEQAKCLCHNCVDNSVGKCMEGRSDVPVMRKLLSKNGLSVLQNEIVSITVSCFCVRPRPPSPPEQEEIPLLD